MRGLLTTGLLLSAIVASAQTGSPAIPQSPSSFSSSTATDLPDAPGATQTQQESVVAVAHASFKETRDGAHPCNTWNAMKVVYFDPNHYGQIPKPCTELIYPYQRFLTTNIVIPLTWQQKGYSALHNLTDPANFGTILGISAITVATDSHSAYGPGMAGFGRSVGVSFSQDAIGQFFGVFAIPVLVHQDPRYFRIPHAPLKKRILYSVSRTFVSRSDDGRTIPNYATLFTYPIGAELGNLYVPGIHTDGPSTVTRILTSYALDPANNLLTEFLPDVASRVHVRIIFVQRILNNIASSNGAIP
jgi:hypothetical protein